MTDFKTALALLKNGKFKDACEILEDLITRDPPNSDMLYNLGMCYTELGKPEAAIRTLTQCIQHAPGFANAYVAMGFAYAELNDFAKAKEFLFKALDIEPNNPYAFRNLGGVFGKEENFANALYYLKKAHEINAHAFLKDMAKDRLREIAVTNAKSHGFRPDAMYYCLNALKLFSTKEFDEVRKISYEIAMKGRDGLDINNPNKKYTLNSLPGYFSGIQLLCYMYVGFKRIAPKEDVGIDFSAEYRMASELFDSEDIL